ncbi:MULTISPECIES: hypothetical protein [Moorena]|uniref:Uncharacterized protein n=3 Tax=Moorena TaxID=1155738 RepID=A0A1D9G395_MOOP1|nr:MULTISPECIES: hypothetical protein [Moorena]AOY82099.1 hypothetical protein BJP36_21515 [Moorena producens JHB]EGJ30831.1 hypothetical protein LYNGBM3L_45420 [Moorena producens 3L]NEP36919.1 hypothetical protein [Moorena sp. SIO3B2]NEP69923.1 hypothetical protein [Moorena sp. SIO3A5]NER87525.1 hypothetical protein [Moorena sp. SIO3A2]
MSIINQKNSKLSEEYRQLIALPFLSELDANRMAEILELANLDESLNSLIEEIEMTDYLKLEKWNQGLRNLLNVVSTEEPSPNTAFQD